MLPPSSRTSEKLLSYHNTTRHHNPDDPNLNLHRPENIKPGTTKYKVKSRYKMLDKKFQVSFRKPEDSSQ